MKGVIYSYNCSDHDPIDKWIPEDVHDIDYWMDFTIGLDDEKGGDIFQVRVTTPNSEFKEPAAKHTIVVSEYSWPNVLSAVDEILEECQGEDWHEISGMLSERMSWEFENYRPYSSD